MATSASKPQSPSLQHPLSGSTFGNWLALLDRHGGIGRPYLSRALGITATTLASAPLQFWETLRYGGQIRRTQIEQPPLFILGHWRSGTTHLHRLMVQDDRWGYVSSMQAFMPEVFLTARQGVLAASLKKLWPDVRLMDNVSYSPDVPEEEDYALANISPFSFYCCWYFPQQMQEIFQRSVLLANLSESDRQLWERSYLKILKKATLSSGGKQLAIKNPSNTARIPELLSLFPDAKFLHIFRNPYDVYSSMLKFYKKSLPHYALQPVNESEIESRIFEFYNLLMQRFFATVAAIPARNFLEVRYEDLDGNELPCLEEIYERLELPEFDAAKEKFATYVKAHANYQKNEYDLDGATRERVRQHWHDAICRWETVPPIGRNASVS